MIPLSEKLWNELPLERQAYVHKGGSPLSMNVYPRRDGAIAQSGRIVLIGGTRPDSPAPVVVYMTAIRRDRKPQRELARLRRAA